MVDDPKRRRATSMAAKKHPQALGDKTPAKHRDTQRAYIVSGEGADEDIRARCLADVPGFADMSERVQGELIRLMRKFWEMPVAPRLEVEKTEAATVIRAPDGSNVTLSAMRTIEALASGSAEYTNRRIEQLTNSASARKDLSTDSLMSDLAFITGGGAQDTVQSTLLTQMAATHNAAMMALNMSLRSDYIEQVTQVGNLANRLLNTFTRQAEVLAKLQRGGEQVVKHVHIDNRHGGQAVVTDTVQTGGAHGRSTGQAYGAASVGAGPALLGQNAQGNGVSIASGSGSPALPDSWLCAGIGGAEGE